VKIVYAACEETTRKIGTDVVQYQGKYFIISCTVPTRNEVEKFLLPAQKIGKINIEGKKLTLIGFEE